MSGRGARARLVVMALVVFGFGAGVAARLAYLQIRQGEVYKSRALKQRERIHRLEPRRGDILDRNGNALAISVPAEVVAARPGRVKDPATTARVLAPLLDRPAAEIERKLRSQRTYVYLSRQVSFQRCRDVEAAQLDGIVLERTTRRIYPNRTLAAHTLGFVNIDHDAQIVHISSPFDKQITALSSKFNNTYTRSLPAAAGS